MNEKASHLKLVVSNKNPILKEKKVHWWRKMHPLQAFQVPVSVLAFTTFVTGIMLYSFEYWHASAKLFCISAVLVFFLWFFEHQVRMDFDLFKTKD